MCNARRGMRVLQDGAKGDWKCLKEAAIRGGSSGSGHIEDLITYTCSMLQEHRARIRVELRQPVKAASLRGNGNCVLRLRQQVRGPRSVWDAPRKVQVQHHGVARGPWGRPASVRHTVPAHGYLSTVALPPLVDTPTQPRRVEDEHGRRRWETTMEDDYVPTYIPMGDEGRRDDQPGNAPSPSPRRRHNRQSLIASGHRGPPLTNRFITESSLKLRAPR